MNVFFMDYRYIRKDAWKYIVQVLKIHRVFCFFDSKELPPSILGVAKIKYKGEKTNVKSFCDSIVICLANKITNYTKNSDGTVIHTDQNLYVESKSEYPRYNLLKTDDQNVLVLGEVFFRHFEKYYDEIEEYDIGLHIANHLLNLLRKQIGNNKYEKRISFLLFDFLRMCEYKRSVSYCDDENDQPCDKYGWYDNDDNYRAEKIRRIVDWCYLSDSILTRNGNIKKVLSFYNIIIGLLHKNFSEFFPLIKCGEKMKYSTFVDRECEEFKKALQKWNEECEEQERIAEEEAKAEREWEQMQQRCKEDKELLEEMNRDFWNECGEAGSNCESWPGWG